MLKDIEIEKIKIQNRYRKDLGNIDSLVKSIADIGLLHPIVLNKNLQLIAGLRRIEAFKRIGYNEIPAYIIDLDNILKGECDENKVRKDFTPSEAVAIGEALLPYESDEAKERQKIHGDTAPGRPSDTSGNLPEVFTGQSRDKVAAAVGMSGRTYEKAKEIVQAAKAEPEKYAPLVEQMDRTGKIEPSYRKMKLKQTTKKPIHKHMLGGILDGEAKERERLSPEFRTAWDSLFTVIKNEKHGKWEVSSKKGVLHYLDILINIVKIGG